MIEIVLLIVLIYFIFENDKIRKELINLKAELNKRNNKHFCPNCGYKLDNDNNRNTVPNNNSNTTPVINNSNNNVVVSNVSVNRTIEKNEVKVVHSDKELKNNLILITGSILLIISALLFLTTTWNYTNGIFKTLILIIMLLIFIATSYIAGNFLHLKHTAKAFYYISLVYIPIIFLSISIFGLIGSFFSITGPGKYIYLAISFLIITLLYYVVYFIKKDKLTGIFSIISSVFSVIFMVAYISTEANIIILGLVIYLLINIIMYIFNIYYVNQKIHKITIITLLAGLSCIILQNNFYNIVLGKIVLSDFIIQLIMFINIYLFFNNIYIKKDIYKGIYPIYIIYLFFILSMLSNTFIYQQLLILISFVLVSLISCFSSKKITDEAFLEIGACSFILIVVSIINTINHIAIVPVYLLLIVLCIISFIYYITSEDKLFPAVCTIGLFMITIFSFLLENGYQLFYLSYIGLILIILSLNVIKEKNLKKASEVVSNVTIIILTFTFGKINIWILLFILLYISLCFIIHIIKKQGVYKVIAYIYFNVFLVAFLNYLDITSYLVLCRILPITSIMLIVLDYFVTPIRDDTNKNYLTVQSLLAMIIISLNNIGSIVNYENLFLTIGLVLLYDCFINYRKIDNTITLISYATLIPQLYLGFNKLDLDIVIYISSLLLMVYYIVMLYLRKNKNFMILYFVYCILHIMFLENSKYISLLLISIGCIVVIIMYDKGVRDLFKGCLYTCILVLFEFIIYDLALDGITAIVFLPFLIWLVIITRTLLIKYNLEYKVWEYLGYIIINCIALIQYKSELDGMVYVFVLVLFVIVSYTLKFGPIFLVCLIAIIVNIFIITRYFWLALPWWLYILFIGSLLIAFAIYNEMHDSKNDGKIMEKIKNKINL